MTATDTSPAADADGRLLARITEQTGQPAVLAGQLSGSILNIVHAVRCDGRDLIAKYGVADGASDGIRREATVLALLADTEVPVAHAVLLPAAPEFPHDLLLLDLLPGQPAAPDSEVLTDAGRSLRRLHEVHAPGFGLVGPGTHGLTGTVDSWAAVIGAALDDARQAIPADVLPTAVHDEAAAQQRQPHIHAHLAGIQHGALLHGDLMRRHVWDDHGRLAGLIDWGDAMIGDPLFDLARFSMSGAAAFDKLRIGYGGPAPDGHVLSFYRMVWSLTALASECRAGGDWFDSYIETVRRELDLMPSS
ncbi:MAG: aminoglycoside phosphotransferase family protein [Catenulispora sp.]|nr:aminoglycoside phosphotransferase family protein [Catenulispora sp.]NUR57264.1 aminoglycoside phosphotransferase family protein [Catenulispora sp.]